MKNHFSKQRLTYLYLSITLIVALITGIQFYQFRHKQAIFVPGPGVSEILKMSDFYAPLKGTIGDADIYVLGTQNPAEPSILVLGGIHANEPAGQLATVLLLENIEVNFGTVYIIPETNRSAYTHSHPQEATPEYYHIETPFGFREFKYGSRATNAIDQWPIPDIYIHQSTGQQLSGTDTRNLNRSFPGKTNGTYTEKVAYAIKQFVIEKDIIITLDLHEASPEYGVNNALVSHERGISNGIASWVMLNMELYGLVDTRFAPIKLEPSPQNLRGLTHRELGDNTRTLSFLAETSNVSQGRVRGQMTEAMIIDGYDKFYERATALGILEVNHSSPVSLNERVARHVLLFQELVKAYNTQEPSFSGDNLYYKRGQFDISYNGLSFDSIYTSGIGAFLLNPEA